MKGRVIDIGMVDRQDVVAPTHLLLDTLLVTNPGAMVEVELLATVETVAENLKYSGTPSKLLGEFPQTSILGFIIMVGRGTKGGGHILVRPPNCYGSKFPYWYIVADNLDGWNEPLVDEIIRFQGICYAVISDDDTLDLQELDHVDKNNFPWEHWRLIAARVPGQT